MHTFSELDKQLRLHTKSKDPLCRYVYVAPHRRLLCYADRLRRFIGAHNARSQLRTSREMLMRILSYHQVMPAFLEFLLSFGKQSRAKDFQFCGFRSDSSINSDRPLLELNTLGRSGRELKLSYSLRSVERAPGSEWPWSIRQCAVYHAYDIETDLANWIIIKANKLLKTRIRSSIDEDLLYAKDMSEAERSLMWPTLQTHLLIASWSAEQWRWYINFLEDRFQEISNRVLTDNVDVESVKQEISAYGTSHAKTEVPEKGAGRDDTFHQLQDIHHIEEKTNEALLVLKGDRAVLTSLNDFYANVSRVLEQQHRPEDCRQYELNIFSSEVQRTQKELTMQQYRLETLDRLLEGRKSLASALSTLTSGHKNANRFQLRSTLQHRNTLMNFIVANKAHVSAKRMEEMTEEMHTVAQSTKLETVSMRIITFVTLVYLPGTFVSVGPYRLWSSQISLIPCRRL